MNLFVCCLQMVMFTKDTDVKVQNLMTFCTSRNEKHKVRFFQ